MKIKIPAFVKKILNTVEKDGYEIYVVGGVVRDLIIDREAVDWDFTTNATPKAVLALFPDGFYDNVFGTVGIVNPQEKKKKAYYGKPPIYEITTFRKEVGYTDRRRPDKVIWGKTLEEDLVRRDFTINAMALKPEWKSKRVKEQEFKLIDPHKGQEDIKAKLIRAVGNPDKRFQEDALRMMRAVRIATQLGFKIEEKTFQAIKKNVDLLDHISAERVRDELLKLLSYKFAADGYMILRNSGLAGKILPEVEKMFGVEQKSPGRHHLDDVGTHAVKSLRATKSSDPTVNLAILIHDVGKPITVGKDKKGAITFYNHEVIGASIARNIGRRLKFSKKDQERLFKIVRWHQFSVDERQTNKAFRRFIKNVGKENLVDILEVRRADRVGGGARETSWRFERFKKKLVEVQKQPFSVADLKVSGNDVMKILNLSPGPLVGRVLNQLFEEVAEDKKSAKGRSAVGGKNTRKYLLKRIKELGKKLI